MAKAATLASVAMGKRGRHRRSGRRHPPQANPSATPRSHRQAEPDLLYKTRQALASPEPLDLLALASMLVSVVDPRSRPPFERPRPTEPQHVERDQLIASFLDVDCVETSALLAVLREMINDEILAARIRRELSTRHYPLPPWLTMLPALEIYRTVEMTHVLRDGNNIIIGTRLATGEELSAVVYIDHNLGTVAKDAFIVPESIADLIDFMREKSDDPDTSWNDIDRADARVRLTDAIETGAITFPPFETETWPAARPLIEWLARRLPKGGQGYERPEWPAPARQDLMDRFFASPLGERLDDHDHRSLLDSLLWFGSDYGPGDPLRWSPTAVEIVLSDWVPRKIVAEPVYLSKLPELLRTFIRYCHHERGIRAALTAETLHAVDEFEPGYQHTIRAPRPQGPAALLARIGALDPDATWALPTLEIEERSYREIMLDALRRAVGDEELDALDDQPLPDEPFDWTDVPDDIHARVGEVAALTDRCCEEALDVEYRTACRRLLARIARCDPNVFRRKSRDDVSAAAVCWIVGKANHLFSDNGRMLVKDLMSYVGLQQGGVSQRAKVMLRAAGFSDEYYGDIHLGSPAFLVSSRRRTVIERRDAYQAMEDD